MPQLQFHAHVRTTVTKIAHFSIIFPAALIWLQCENFRHSLCPALFITKSPHTYRCQRTNHKAARHICTSGMTSHKYISLHIHIHIYVYTTVQQRWESWQIPQFHFNVIVLLLCLHYVASFKRLPIHKRYATSNGKNKPECQTVTFCI